MNFQRLFKKDSKTSGFSLIEILVVLMIVSIISAIAIPRYLAAKNKEYITVAQSDGDNIYREVNNALADITSFGSTNGTIAFDTTTNIMTITLGSGGQSIGTFSENVSNGTSISGVTYGNTLNWCINVANNGAHAVFNQDGYQASLSACP